VKIKDDIQLATGNYAVIFITERRDDMNDYNEMDARTMEEVSKMDGYLGYESLRVAPLGIFISYWRDRASVDRWKEYTLHKDAKTLGIAKWYDAYRSIICPIENIHFFRRASS
jgi:heme-degrading monooxygenase HmoA